MDRQEVGRALSEKRAMLGLSLDDVARATLLRKSVIEVLEAGGPPQPDGFQRSYLRRYANFLKLNADEILEAFSASPALVPTSDAAAANPIKPKPEGSHVLSFRKSRSVVSYVAVVVVALMVAMVVLWRPWQVQPKGPGGATTPSGTPSVPTETASPSAVELATPSAPAAGSETPAPKAMTLMFTATTQRAWLQIRADGALVFSGILRPGDSTQVTGNYIVVDFGNARYTSLTENGVDKGVVSSDKTVLTVEYGSTSHAP
jgi:cytoskeletal protein RodZ